MNTTKSTEKGILIVLCGGEGSGKSSVLEAIMKAFPDMKTTREPGGTDSPYAEAIRDLMFKNALAKNANADAMFGLFWASRAEHLDKFVIPTINAGVSIVSDRFDCCTYAYQLCAQNGSHLKELFWQNRAVYLRDVAPTMYIFLDVDPEIGLKRVAGRPGKKNHFDERDFEFHRKVREGYREFFANLEDRQLASNHCIVDASQALNEVSMQVVDIIEALRS